MDNRIKIIVALFTFLFVHTAFADTQFIVNSYQYAVESSPCPAFYQDTNVVYSWDGDHNSGPNYACNNSGTGIAGTNTNLTISTSYGESGSNGALIDSIDERLEFPDTGDQYINDVGPQTIWLRIYVDALPTSNDIVYFEANHGGTVDYLVMNIAGSNDSQRGEYRGNSVSDTVTGGIPAIDTWIDVAYSWDYTEDDHSTYDGSSWTDDLNEGFNAMTGNLTSFMIGEEYSESSDDATGIVWVTQFALMNGWKTAKPANW